MSKVKKFHIGKNGASECEADENSCPLGGAHFTTLDEARAEYERVMEDSGDHLEPQQKGYRPRIDMTLEQLRPVAFELDESGDVIIPEALRSKILEEIDNGYIRPAYEYGNDSDDALVMLKYSRSAMYEAHWNEATVACRGVLTDKNLTKVYARGFGKFFNTSEHDGHRLPELDENEEFVVEEKMDGSLGLITKIDGEYRVFTNGSAQRSDITTKGDEILQRLTADKEFNLPRNHTMLVEIISPVNRIVVDYGDDERLVGLGLMNNLTGDTAPREEMEKVWIGEVVPETSEPLPLKELAELPVAKNSEGFVATSTTTGLKVKLKGEDYKITHRLVTNLSTRQLSVALHMGNYDDLRASVAHSSPGRGLAVLEGAKAEIDRRVREEFLQPSKEKFEKAYEATPIEYATATPDGRKQFVQNVQQNFSKNDFGNIIALWQGREDKVWKTGYKSLKIAGKESIIGLVSAEQSEVGDADDDG